MEFLRDARFRIRSFRCGNQLVRSREANPVFLEIVAPELKALEFRQERDHLVRRVSSEIMQLVGLAQLRGAYCLKWGVSLGYVPKSWDERITWTSKRQPVHFDLFEAPAIASDRSPDDLEEIVASAIHGPRFFGRDLERLWLAQKSEILLWIAENQTIEAVGRTARMQRELGPNWHDPSPELIEAFSLARLGMQDQAAARLSAFVSSNEVAKQHAKLLRAALSDVMGR